MGRPAEGGHAQWPSLLSRPGLLLHIRPPLQLESCAPWATAFVLIATALPWCAPAAQEEPPHIGRAAGERWWRASSVSSRQSASMGAHEAAAAGMLLLAWHSG